MSDLAEEALDVALGRLEGEGPMLPFALVKGEGTSACTTIVTDRSDRAAYLGRRIVRESAAALDAYAIATDAFIFRDGRRLDAIIVEAGTRGARDAALFAQPYDRTGSGPARRVGEPALLGHRPCELAVWDPLALDWGASTPDVYLDERKQAIHAVNHDLESDENVARTLRFVRARIRFHAPNLPEGSEQLVSFDDRGQTLTSATRAALRTLADVAQIAFTTEVGP